jgi:hypothetical protein
MNQVFIRGCGAVSPAGWGVASLLQAVHSGQMAPVQRVSRPGWDEGLPVRAVPAPPSRLDFLKHPRMRRTSPVTQYALAAALEAVGPDLKLIRGGGCRLGIVFCTMSGCVNYSRRFYDEVLHDPATASPLIFPETVFNAPGSHLAAYFSTTMLDYTLVGDPPTFLQGLAMAADWLRAGVVEAGLVVGAEEKDWLTADAFRLFSPHLITSEGAGALYLKGEPAAFPSVALDAITDAWPFATQADRLPTCRRMRSQLPVGTAGDLLCDGIQNIASVDEPEIKAWAEWPGNRLSLKCLLGEGLTAGSAWQCIAAAKWLEREPEHTAIISVTGYNQHIIGARFTTGLDLAKGRS